LSRTLVARALYRPRKWRPGDDTHVGLKNRRRLCESDAEDEGWGGQADGVSEGVLHDLRRHLLCIYMPFSDGKSKETSIQVLGDIPKARFLCFADDLRCARGCWGATTGDFGHVVGVVVWSTARRGRLAELEGVGCERDLTNPRIQTQLTSRGRKVRSAVALSTVSHWRSCCWTELSVTSSHLTLGVTRVA
jgi:hypothetical protein